MITARGHRCTLASLLLVVGACRPGAGYPSPATSVDAPHATRPSTSDSILGNIAWAEITNAGIDTIAISRREMRGASRPVLVVTGPSLKDSIGLETDVVPSIVGFGDLDGDGRRDIVLLAVDESSALPIVVLATARGLKLPTPKPQDLWKEAQVTWSDEGPADSCEMGLRPLIESTTGRPATISVAIGSIDNGLGCAQLHRMSLRVAGDTISEVP